MIQLLGLLNTIYFIVDIQIGVQFKATRSAHSLRDPPFQMQFLSKGDIFIWNINFSVKQLIISFKSFTRAIQLKYHEILHTGEKRFQCKICSKVNYLPVFYLWSSIYNNYHA